MLRIGYHDTSSDERMNGITRYLINIISSSNGKDLHFVNCAPKEFMKSSILSRVYKAINVLLGLNIRSSGINVYWGPAHRLPLFRMKNISYVLTVHDLVWKICPDTMSLTGRLMERLFYSSAIKNADIIIAVSDNTAKDLVKYFPKYSHKVRIIPLANSLNKSARTKYSPKCVNKYILYVGTIEPRKNDENILLAYSSLSDATKKHYKLILVGRMGWGGINIKRLIAKNNLTNHAEYHHYDNDQQLMDLYKNAYCLLFPSFYEGFGLPILEAHNFGIPVITSNLSSMPEILGEGGLLVNPYSTESIQKSIELMINNPELRNSLSEKAKINSKKFSWEKTIQKTHQSFIDSIDVNIRN